MSKQNEFNENTRTKYFSFVIENIINNCCAEDRLNILAGYVDTI
jgi:hypothetical protein